MGVAKALEQLPPHITAPQALDLLKFIIPGVLGDPNGQVQEAMMATARTAISNHGEVSSLVSLFRC